jgi:hypothetical protein
MGTYDFLRFTLAEVSRDPASLLTAVREADEKTVASVTQQLPIDFELTDKSRPYNLKALESQVDVSDVSGAKRVVFGTKPLDLTVPMYDDFRVKTSIVPPVAYVVPVQWKEVIEVLKAHGLTMQVLQQSESIEVESYRFTDVKWPGGPFEGRLMPSFKVETVRERRQFPAGSVVVPTAQVLARLVINLLEPQAPDSLVRWGFFNATFEQKEYGEDYVVEKLAREMLAKDPQLKAEYEKRLASDPAFAGSSHARLQFFYRRSPYWDPQMNVYPVGRVTK